MRHLPSETTNTSSSRVARPPSPSRLHQVFSIITSNFSDVDPGVLASLHDTPWTMIKLAHVARKQRLNEVCLNALSKLYSVDTMDVQV